MNHRIRVLRQYRRQGQRRAVNGDPMIPLRTEIIKVVIRANPRVHHHRWLASIFGRGQTIKRGPQAGSETLPGNAFERRGKP